MSVQLLVSAVDKDVHNLPEKMNIQCDLLLVNQLPVEKEAQAGIQVFSYKGYEVKAYSMQEKGVGLSRNTALERADHEISLFGDEDIVYEDGYASAIEKAFEEHPEADMLLFNVQVTENRRTYWTEQFHRVHQWNCGRYPAYSFALRTEKMHEANLKYHLWFGGGARYSNGEDSLFIRDALRTGLRCYAIPVCIGQEIPRENEESTWFHGYNEKFFYDRGVLYHYLYGKLAPLMAARFLLRNKETMCKDISVKEASRLMHKGFKREGLSNE